jgi:hypothetical protein
MLKLKMEIIMGRNHLKLMKNNKIMIIMKKMKLKKEMILNLQRRIMKQINIHQKEVKREILGYIDQYHILKR